MPTKYDRLFAQNQTVATAKVALKRGDLVCPVGLQGAGTLLVAPAGHKTGGRVWVVFHDAEPEQSVVLTEWYVLIGDTGAYVEDELLTADNGKLVSTKGKTKPRIFARVLRVGPDGGDAPGAILIDPAGFAG